jgi:hypothetical protein
MKKLALYVIGIVLIIAAIVVVNRAMDQSRNHQDKSAQPATASNQARGTACELFTLADAKKLMGESSVKAAQNPTYSSSADLNVSTCVYSQEAVAGIALSKRDTASLLARIPKSDKGVISNNNEFGPLRPVGVQDVPGYGDSAYWDAEHGQLNILKNNNWYVLSFGATASAGRSLDQAKQMADLIIDRL